MPFGSWAPESAFLWGLPALWFCLGRLSLCQAYNYLLPHCVLNSQFLKHIYVFNPQAFIFMCALWELGCFHSAQLAAGEGTWLLRTQSRSCCSLSAGRLTIEGLLWMRPFLPHMSGASSSPNGSSQESSPGSSAAPSGLCRSLLGPLYPLSSGSKNSSLGSPRVSSIFPPPACSPHRCPQTFLPQHPPLLYTWETPGFLHAIMTSAFSPDLAGCDFPTSAPTSPPRVSPLPLVWFFTPLCLCRGIPSAQNPLPLYPCLTEARESFSPQSNPIPLHVSSELPEH